ncbi:hypothetical protein [Flammeovirga aprica]|uniref:Outer membrane protein beta-barrel domain-containing protein n=1 Tax=Flammeovirga aprica JL-4 TaxID=694437 RepID=A0A7X9RX93_9BACT|nr:hypothetical protein [Flammeovirga aprica]NME70387.1 hypothetical protein [Flammeovirga aprica JL-4]
MENRLFKTMPYFFIAALIILTIGNLSAQDRPKGYLSVTTSGSRVMQRDAYSKILSMDYNHYVSDSWMIGVSLIGDWERETTTSFVGDVQRSVETDQPFKSSIAIYGTYLFGKNKHWGVGGGYAKDIISGSDFKLGNDYVDGFVMYFIPIKGFGYICPRVGYVHDIQDQEQSISAGVSFSIPLGGRK